MRINNQQMKGNDHDSKTNGPGNRGMAEAAHRRRLNSLRAEATKLIEGELGSPAFMMASLPMLLAYVLIDSRRVTHWICVGCTFASVLIHPIWIDAFNSGSAGQTPDSDGITFERPSFEEKQRWRRDLIQSALRGDRDYKKQTENGLALSVLLKSESNWMMRRTQPGLFWLFPPSIALALVGVIILMFGGKPNSRSIDVNKAGTPEP